MIVGRHRDWYKAGSCSERVWQSPVGPEKSWAAKIHLSGAPVYYHNYVLGHPYAAQLRSYPETRVTGGPFFADEMAGRYLQEAVFGPGARNAWGETVLGATGEKLNPKHFVDSLRR